MNHDNKRSSLAIGLLSLLAWVIKTPAARNILLCILSALTGGVGGHWLGFTQRDDESPPEERRVYPVRDFFKKLLKVEI